LCQTSPEEIRRLARYICFCKEPSLTDGVTFPLTPTPTRSDSAFSTGEMTMKMDFAVLVLASSFLAIGCANADDAKQQSEKLQGTWGAVTFIQDGQGEGPEVAPDKSPVRWVFKEDRVTFLADVEEASAKGIFKLDPSAKPNAIDVSFPAAPNAKQGQTFLGIYELDGETLKICYDPDGKKRPAEFQAKAGSNRILAVFKRAKK
jgi:uncharacterized protein (TIGR03067 family)